ncbi:MAG: N-acetylmannosamine-6-phosphate 2-epimerase [Clostridiales bacterium]|jgi:N-acylglucosamine-6-phosphate 2-epimerase|nr:N-acetylmannosamine-6-phosphate 2-epimerase [Clostridiales bacterium]
MSKEEILKKIYKGVIVSCQALEHEPLYGAEIMARMAIAAKEGGAVGIRANYPQDIRAIRKEVDLPLIGIYKVQYADSEAYITPTLKEVEEVIKAGADIVAVDCTKRLKPANKTTEDFIREIRENFTTIIMADISTYEEGLMAEELGVDMISTTLSGYTPYSPQIEGPDFELVERLSKAVDVPVIAEGRIWTSQEAVKALELGAYAVVIGAAITRPQKITERFTRAVFGFREKQWL